MVRVLVMLSVATSAMAFAPSMAQAQTCPSNAVQASIVVWPMGNIRTGQTVTGTHPCGRRITCTGGNLNTPGSRVCSWL